MGFCLWSCAATDLPAWKSAPSPLVHALQVGFQRRCSQPKEDGALASNLDCKAGWGEELEQLGLDRPW